MRKTLFKRHRRLRRASHRAARRKFLLWAAVCLLGVATVVLLRPSSPNGPFPSAAAGNKHPAQLPSESLRVAAKGPSTSSRVYFVIPEGIHSKQQLAKELATDPVVARHYADFDLQKFRFVRLRRGREAYVSYRLGNHIYWTSKKIPLYAGETLVTDGTNLARARCGNRISDVPRQPTSPRQPPLLSLSLPILHPNPVLPALPPLTGVNVQPLPSGIVPGSSGDGSLFPVIFLPPGGGTGGGPGSSQQPDPPVAVPEPPTIVLFLTGLAVLALGFFWKSRRHRI